MNNDFMNFPDLFFCKTYEESVALYESINRKSNQSNQSTQSHNQVLETRIEKLEERVAKMEAAIVSEK
tara:strand:- start:266 stop:469 length:204 start_codon:yes stop_codon:yes gene_type:complete